MQQRMDGGNRKENQAVIIKVREKEREIYAEAVKTVSKGKRVEEVEEGNKSCASNHQSEL